MFALSHSRAEKEFAITSFHKNFPNACKHLLSYEHDTWCALDMAQKHNVACYGHSTSNIVEGENGNLKHARSLHPYKMIQHIVRYAAQRMAISRKKVMKLSALGRKLTPFAKEMFEVQLQLTRDNAAYTIEASGAGYAVWDTQAKYQVRHQVNLGLEPSCSPCNIFGHYKLSCRHILLVIAKHEPDLLSTPEGHERLLDLYFHPAYLIKNQVLGFQNVEITVPIAPSGRPLPPPVYDLVSSESEDSDEEEELEEKRDRMSKSHIWLHVYLFVLPLLF